MSIPSNSIRRFRVRVQVQVPQNLEFRDQVRVRQKIEFFQVRVQVCRPDLR